MSQYLYKARDAKGQMREGTIEADTAAAVADDLMQRSLTPLSIEETAGEKETSTDALEAINRHFNKPGRAELILFSRQMHSLTKAGIPIITGLNRLAESTSNEQLADIIDNIVDDLESGRDLAAAMAKYEDIFGGLYISMIRIGEQTGRIDESFYKMYEYLERDENTIRNIKSAIRYPTLVLGMIVIAVIIIMIFVIPKFAEIYESFKIELPLMTRIIIGASNFFVNSWVLMVGGIVSGFFAFRYFINTEDGRLWWDKSKLRFPVVGDIVLRGTLARFAGAFAMTYRSGLPITEGMNVVSRAVDNEYIGQKVRSMREGIERGESLTNVTITSRVFTSLVIQMIVVGEETGQLEDMLEEVAEYYEREVDYDVKRLSSLIEPILTVAIGALVLILALGVFLPMWDLVKAVQ